MTTPSTDLCLECDQRPVWADDRKRAEPWHLCVDCLAEIAAGIRRRREALSRLQPLVDLLGPGVESITVTFTNDNGPRR